MLGMSHGADPPCCVNIKFFIMALEYTARTAENQRVCIALSQKRRAMFFVCSPITETAMHIYQMTTSQKCEGLLLACIYISYKMKISLVLLALSTGKKRVYITKPTDNRVIG